MKKLNLRLPDVQHDRIKTLASQRGRSFSKLSGEFSLKALAEFDTEDRFRISASRGNRVNGLAVPDVPDRKRGKHRKDEARLGAKLQNYRRIGFRTDRENGACCEALLAGGLSVLSDIFVH